MTQRPLLALGALVFGVLLMGASPSPFPRYAPDELLVEFTGEPLQAEVETVELKYALRMDHRLHGPPTFLFVILDGIDAREKQQLVAAEPNVCRVTLNWIGEFLSTAPEPPRPFGRCEGDDVDELWTPGVETPESTSTPLAGSAIPTSSPEVPPASVSDGQQPISSAALWAGVLGTLLIGLLFVVVALARRVRTGHD